jgi:hypothetical protein
MKAMMMVRGVFVIWRHGQDKETIYDWGTYHLQEGEDPPPLLNFKPEIICEARVPIMTTKDPNAILKEDADRALEILHADLVNQVKTRSDLARVRQQFEPVIRNGKPRPPVEIVDNHDWNELWKNATAM